MASQLLFDWLASLLKPSGVPVCGYREYPMVPITESSRNVFFHHNKLHAT